MAQTKRGRGRPPKNGKRAMSSVERQRQYRERLRQSRRLAPPSRQPDDETHRLIRNILGTENDAEVGEALRRMRGQLSDSLALVLRVEAAMKTIRGEMYQFAIGGKQMDRETRRAVFAELCELDTAARRARKSLLSDYDNPPAWARGEREWT